MLWTKLDTATSRGCRVPGAPPQGPGIADMHQGFSEKTKPISVCHIFFMSSKQKSELMLLTQMKTWRQDIQILAQTVKNQTVAFGH